MGKPWNNESAEKWWACGRHVRQKELAPSAKVRRTTPEVVRAPPQHLLVRRRCCASKRACAVTQSCRASIVRRTATTRRPARPLGRRRCSEPRSRSQPAGRHGLAVSSEGALRLRCSASSVACASEFKPLYRRESVREREPRERGQGFIVHWRITGVVNRPVTNQRPLMRVTKPVTRYGRITSVSAACNAPVTLYLAKSARRGTDARCVGR